MKKTEYMGPDGDLVANLERDVLDRSPGIRCVCCVCCHLRPTRSWHVTCLDLLNCGLVAQQTTAMSVSHIHAKLSFLYKYSAPAT